MRHREFGFFCNFNLFWFTLCIYQRVFSVPIEYCMAPLNKSDCNLKPTAVFSYYKPGSRCEIEIWRGCPTLNKFHNEFECSHYCIGKLDRDPSNSLENFATNGTQNLTVQKDPCEGKLNTESCGLNNTEVYTYENGTCQVGLWKGCQSNNKFDDEASCIETCKTTNVSLIDWNDKLQQLPKDEVDDINDLLDKFIDSNETTEEPQIKQLSLFATTKRTPPTTTVTEHVAMVATTAANEATTALTTESTTQPATVAITTTRKIDMVKIETTTVVDEVGTVEGVLAY